MADYEYHALHWEKASMEMGVTGTRVFTSANITMARFDISEPEHAEIAQQYTTRDDTPTLKMFYNGAFLTDIQCPVVHHEIRQFIISQTIPSVMDIQSAASLRKWKRRKHVNQANLKFLIYLNPLEPNHHELKIAFHNVATELKSTIQFGQVTNASLFLLASKSKQLSDHIHPQSGEVVFFRDFGLERTVQYTSAKIMDLAHVLAFVHQYSTPLLTNLADPEEFRVRDYLRHPLPYRLLVFFKTPEVFENLRPALETYAADLRNKDDKYGALVAYSIEDPQDESNFDYIFWQVSGKDPTFLYLDLAKDRKYVYSGDDALEIETMRSFIARVEAKDVVPKLRSEVAPVKNTGPVRIVTTTSFEKDVWHTRAQDTLVLLHDVHSSSSWSSDRNHPVLDQMTTFAKVWRREKRLSVVSIDCRQNDIVEWDDLLFHDGETAKTTLPILVYIAKEDKVRRDVTGVWSKMDMIPDMQDLMEFVSRHTQMQDLERDDKVWSRIPRETDERERATTERDQHPPPDDPERGTQACFERVDSQERETDATAAPDESVKVQAPKSSAAQDIVDQEDHDPPVPKQTFPSSFDELAFAQEALEIELRTLMKSTGGVNLNDSEESLALTPSSELQPSLWTLVFLLNLAIVSVFGSGVQGAAVMVLLLLSLVLALGWVRRHLRRRAMHQWLLRFYTDHRPAHIKRIPDILNLYLTLDRGFDKVREDCIRKYVIETKKSN